MRDNDIVRRPVPAPVVTSRDDYWYMWAWTCPDCHHMAVYAQPNIVLEAVPPFGNIHHCSDGAMVRWTGAGP